MAFVFFVYVGFMADCFFVVKSSPENDNLFLSKFKFNFVQLDCGVIHSVCVLDHLSYFSL